MAEEVIHLFRGSRTKRKGCREAIQGMPALTCLLYCEVGTIFTLVEPQGFYLFNPHKREREGGLYWRGGFISPITKKCRWPQTWNSSAHLDLDSLPLPIAMIAMTLCASIVLYNTLFSV